MKNPFIDKNWTFRDYLFLHFGGGIILLFLLMLFTRSAESADLLNAEERAYLIENSPIIFVSQTTYPPFEFLEKQGDHTGMTVELARWMATELEFKAWFMDDSLKNAQQAILAGKADVLTSLFFSKKRDRIFDFTDTLFQVPALIFIAADRPDIKNIEGLNHKIIAMQKGDYALEFLKSKNITFEVVYTNNFVEATDLVISKKVDAIIGDEQIVMYYLYSNNLNNYIKKVGQPLYIGQNCMSVKEGNKLLQSILNKGIDLARKKGALDRINRKWLGTRITLEESFVYSYRLQILGLLMGLVAIALIIWISNIRLRKKVLSRTQDLTVERRRLTDILQGTNIGTWEWNIQTGETIFNRRWAGIIGYTLEEISPVSIETWTQYSHPDDLSKSNELLENHFNGASEYYDCEARMKHKNGDWIWIQDRGRVSTWTEDGKPLLMSGTHQDITGTKQVEEQIRNSLLEKETLLQEIHHRVKNNLAVILSLLNLQANNSESKELKDALKDSQSRIHSMSAIHEMLYQSENLASINMKEYLLKLAKGITENYLPRSQVNLDIQVENFVIDVEKASPLGLIINELISNSTKHAFPEGRKGNIQITLTRPAGDQVELIYQDDGIGISDNFDWQEPHSMGMNLVKVLVEGQLKGSIQLSREKGTSFTIKFSLTDN